MLSNLLTATGGPVTSGLVASPGLEKLETARCPCGGHSQLGAWFRVKINTWVQTPQLGAWDTFES